jgi:5'-nucleotidase / UDP-sugar diphosphatase
MIRSVILYVLVLGSTLLGAETSKDTLNLTIFTFNDVYDVDQQNGFGGLAGLKTILDLERKKPETEHYFTAMAGDFLSPSIYSNVSKGKHMIDLFHLLEVDVVTFGNHEFDFDLATIAQRMNESRFAWVGTNVIDLHTGLPFNGARPHLVFQLGEFKIGIIGLTTTETAELTNAPRDIQFAPVILSAQAAVHTLKKKGVDVLIALTHLGITEDILLARTVPEINLILGGHDHEPYALMEGNTLIYKAGMDAHYLGRIDLHIERRHYTDKAPRVMIYPSHQLIVNHDYRPDEKVLDLLATYQALTNARKMIQLGIVSGEISSKHVREGESSFGNLVTNAMRKAYQADIALLNSGAIRGDRIYPNGSPITREDLQKELPFGNVATLVEMSGEQILQALEYAVARMEERTGGFLQVSGLSMLYDPKGIKGQRIREVLINQRPLDKLAYYKVAITDYMNRSGDGNIALSKGKTLVTAGSGYQLLDIVSDYIKRTEIIKETVEGRILEREASKDVEMIQNMDVKRIWFSF